MCWRAASGGRRFDLSGSGQGAQAAADIVRRTSAGGRRAECDVLILARGGGPWRICGHSTTKVGPRHRRLAHTIITGIGHEVISR